MRYQDEVKRAAAKRAARVARLRKQGKTYAEIGVLLGVSRQRVWQIATREAFQTKETKQ